MDAAPTLRPACDCSIRISYVYGTMVTTGFSPPISLFLEPFSSFTSIQGSVNLTKVLHKFLTPKCINCVLSHDLRAVMTLTFIDSAPFSSRSDA